jgi:hypothetical protein
LDLAAHMPNEFLNDGQVNATEKESWFTKSFFKKKLNKKNSFWKKQVLFNRYSLLLFHIEMISFVPNWKNEFWLFFLSNISLKSIFYFIIWLNIDYFISNLCKAKSARFEEVYLEREFELNTFNISTAKMCCWTIDNWSLQKIKKVYETFSFLSIKVFIFLFQLLLLVEKCILFDIRKFGIGCIIWIFGLRFGNKLIMTSLIKLKKNFGL